MKTVLQQIIDELENELKEMDIDEHLRFLPIFKWMQKLCKLHMIEERKIIEESWDLSRRDINYKVTGSEYFEMKFKNDV